MLVNKIRRSLLDAEGEWRGSSETQVNQPVAAVNTCGQPSRIPVRASPANTVARDYVVQSLGLKLAFGKIKEM